MQHIPDALQRSHQLIRPVAMQMIHNCLEPTFAARLGDYRLHMMGAVGYGLLNYAVLAHSAKPDRHCVIHFTDDGVGKLAFVCAQCTEAASSEIYDELEQFYQHQVKVLTGNAAHEMPSDATAHAAEERSYGNGHAK